MKVFEAETEMRPRRKFDDESAIGRFRNASVFALVVWGIHNAVVT